MILKQFCADSFENAEGVGVEISSSAAADISALADTLADFRSSKSALNSGRANLFSISLLRVVQSLM
jgi:hypothetical protein